MGSGQYECVMLPFSNLKTEIINSHYIFLLLSLKFDLINLGTRQFSSTYDIVIT